MESLSLKQRIEQAAARTHLRPSQAQREAGNYPKGHFPWNGLRIAIETPKGAIRTGVSKSGARWAVQMPGHYGYFKKTVSDADGDQVDVIVGPHPESDLVCVVDQVKPGGKFDEHKVVVGCVSVQEARELYLACYSAGWTALKSITPMTRQQFVLWLRKGNTGRPIDRQVSLYVKGDDQPRDADGKFSHADHVLKTAGQIESGWHNGALVSARELRKHSGLSKPDFDKAVYELAMARQITPHKHDFATGLSDQERDELVDTAHGDSERSKIHPNDGRYWVGIAKGKGAPGMKYSRVELAAARYSLQSQSDKKEQWITIHPHGHEEGTGTPVKIDGKGNIVGGPKGIADKGIKKLSDFGKGKGTKNTGNGHELAQEDQRRTDAAKERLKDVDVDFKEAKEAPKNQEKPAHDAPFRATDDADLERQVKDRIRDVIGDIDYENADIERERNWLRAIDGATNYLLGGPRAGSIPMLDKIENLAYKAFDHLEEDAVDESPKGESKEPSHADVAAAKASQLQLANDSPKFTAKGNEVHDANGVRHGAFRDEAKAKAAADEWNKNGKPGQNQSKPASEPESPTSDFDKFRTEYLSHFKNANKYKPNEVGSQHFTNKMAEMSDAHPDWVEKIENEGAPKEESPKPASDRVELAAAKAQRQVGLFSQRDLGGAPQLFDTGKEFVKPKKGSPSPVKDVAPSKLEQIEDELKGKAEEAKPLAGQKSLLDRQSQIDAIRNDPANAVALSSPLMSEGSISPAQVGMMSPREREKWQTNSQKRMDLESQMKQLGKSDDQLSQEKSKADDKTKSSRLNQIDSLIQTMSNLKGKNGKILPKYQREIEKLNQERARLSGDQADAGEDWDSERLRGNPHLMTSAQRSARDAYYEEQERAAEQHQEKIRQHEAGKSPIWKQEKPHRERGQLGEISGLQASRTSQRQLDRLNARADSRMGNVSEGLSGYSQSVIEAHERGDVDENTPGIHTDARMVIQDHKKRKAEADRESKARDISSSNEIHPDELKVGMTVFTGMGPDSFEVAKINQNSVTIKRRDGSTVRVPKDSLTRMSWSARQAAQREARGETYSRISLAAARIEKYARETRPIPTPKSRDANKPESTPPTSTGGSGKKTKSGWITLGGGSHVHIGDDGKILHGCPGLKGEHVQSLKNESDESRKVREVRQAHAEARGLTGHDVTAGQAKQLASPNKVKQHEVAKQAARGSGHSTANVLRAMSDAHEMSSQDRQMFRPALDRLMKVTGATPAKARDWENVSYKDHSSWPDFDHWARVIAADHPELGMNKDDHDTPAKLWDLLREEGQRTAGDELHSPEIARAAVEMLGKPVRGRKSSVSPDSDPDSDFGDTSFDPDRFSRVELAQARYQKFATT